MKLANAIEGGIAGATTLTLLEKAIQNIDTKPPKLKLLNKPGIIKHLKKKSKKKGNNKVIIDAAKELLTAGAYYGVIRFGSKDNVLVRGALLGALTGLGVAFLDKKDDKNVDKSYVDKSYVDKSANPDNITDKKTQLLKFWNENRDKILTVAMFTGGGVLAGSAIKKIKKMKKKNKKK